MGRRHTTADDRSGHDDAEGPPRPRRALTPEQLEPIARACAALSRCVSDGQLGACLAGLVAGLCAPRSVVVTCYGRGLPPRTLFHNIDDRAFAATITLYERGPYRLDPFFLACIDERRAGVFRLSAVAPDNFTRTAYYLDFYRRLRMGEEAGLLLPLPSQAGIVVSLESGAADARFRASEIDWLSAFFPLIEAAVAQYWQLREVASAPTRSPSIDGMFEAFGRGILSNRESEVARLILQGHSSVSIAAQLGIAPGTVKMHRKHAYQKLGVSSQAQLFRQFMATIDSG